MKRTLFVLGVLATTLMVFAGCKPEPKPEPKPEGVTSIKVDPSSVSLEVGKTKELKVTCTPEGVTFKPTFSSDKPEIATVSDKGVITAVAGGKAVITVQIGEKKATCNVTVPMLLKSPKNQLPIMKFGENVADEIAAYEEQLGRKLQNNVLIQPDPELRTESYVEPFDLIPVVAYGLYVGAKEAIVALGTEPIDNCERTLTMLKENGFPDAALKNVGQLAIMGHTEDKKITVVAQEKVITDVDGQPDTNMMIWFLKAPDAQLPKKDHDCVSNVKDFPSWTEFMTKDVDKIKAYEKKLGFRSYVDTLSMDPICNLDFDIIPEKKQLSNFTWVYYVGTPLDVDGEPFINAQINCVDDPAQLESPEIKEWLAINGFGTDFKKVGDNWYYVWNSDKSLGLQLFIDGNGTDVMLEIHPGKYFNESKAKKMRELALKPENGLLQHLLRLKLNTKRLR